MDTDLEGALEAHLSGNGNQSPESSGSTSLDPLSRNLDSGEISNTPRRHSIIGGTNATAATSSRDLFEVYKSIENFKASKPQSFKKETATAFSVFHS